MGREYGSRTNNFSASREMDSAHAARAGWQHDPVTSRGPAMKCITVLYPAKDNDAFDFEFYLRRHVALIQDILGKSLHRIEVRKGATAQDGSSAPIFTSVI